MDVSEISRDIHFLSEQTKVTSWRDFVGPSIRWNASPGFDTNGFSLRKYLDLRKTSVDY